MWFPPSRSVWYKAETAKLSNRLYCQTYSTWTISPFPLYCAVEQQNTFLFFTSKTLFGQEVFRSDIARDLRDFGKDVSTSFDGSCDLLVFKTQLPSSHLTLTSLLVPLCLCFLWRHTWSEAVCVSVSYSIRSLTTSLLDCSLKENKELVAVCLEMKRINI